MIDPLAVLMPVELDAASGTLPAWARVTPRRREHMSRVAALMEQWAGDAGHDEVDRLRWAAAGWLHDALRDENPETMRGQVEEAFRSLPGPLLHGPAAARRLEGEVHRDIVVAVRFHTVGHPSMGRIGKALYLADFLEPGRDFREEWRAELRGRMPEDLDDVLREVVAARIQHLLERRKPIRPETAAFWSSMVSESGR